MGIEGKDVPEGWLYTCPKGGPRLWEGTEKNAAKGYIQCMTVRDMICVHPEGIRDWICAQRQCGMQDTESRMWKVC
jgi:hypothetical protein